MAAKPEFVLQSLLEVSGIGRVIYVDDVFAFRGDVEVEQAIGWFSQALRISPDRARELVSVTFPVSDEDTWRMEFREKWEEMDLTDRKNVTDDLSKILNSQLGRDEEVASQLRQLFPAEFDYHEVSPSFWVEQRKTLLADMPPNSRVVCLFDQDLSAEEGFSEKGPRSGGGLLKDLIAEDNENTCICAIFSHTIKTIDDEYDYHRAFCTDYQIDELDSNKYLPLTKVRLNKPIEYVDGIKKLLLHELTARIKSSVLSNLDEAHQSARDKIQSFDIYTFDRIVLGAARQENEWELDTIVRLFQSFLRKEVRQRLSEPSIAENLSALIANARPVSEVETFREENVYPRVRKIRKEELYEDATLIRYRPLETGDIFVADCASDRPRHYMLLAQPCDLAVRAQGTRTKDYVPLIPIVEANDKYTNKKTRLEWKKYWSTLAVIDNFFDDPSLLAILELKNAITVSTKVLDLAVLDSDGRCTIDPPNAAIPRYLTEGWQKLLRSHVQFYAALNDNLKHIMHVLENPICVEIRDKVWQSMLPVYCFPSVLPEVSYKSGVFDFGLRRVQRLRHPDAEESLKAYTLFLSREAKDFGLGA